MVYDYVATCASLGVYALIEALWISNTTSFYRHAIIQIQGNRLLTIDRTAAVVCYVILFAAVYMFLIHPIVNSAAHCPTLASIVLRAVTLALAIHGVYNLTNKATLAGYSWKLTIVDMMWGVFAMLTVSLTAYCVKLSNNRRRQNLQQHRQ